MSALSLGMILGLLSPFAALIITVVLYARHAANVERGRRVSVAVYAVGVLVVASAMGFFGTFWGIDLACPAAGNLCGLFGFFAIGPIAGLIGATLVGLALFLIPSAPKT